MYALQARMTACAAPGMFDDLRNGQPVSLAGHKDVVQQVHHLRRQLRLRCRRQGPGSFQLERQIAYLPGVAEGAGHASLFSGAISYLA